ncbi:MAG: hypothetical protein CL610_02510 [Anaerolineaceae bacterium]|nr:hypothetical protein [Anaerolineaceae bacterium]
MTLDEFLDNVCQRPLPQNPLARIRTLAKELAEGALAEIWDVNIRIDRGRVKEASVETYFTQRWDNSYPKIPLAARSGYLHYDGSMLTIEQSAFELVEETEPSTIFISYRRSESSAFALLVLKYLKEAGLEPFLDMSLVPGEDWHAGLKERIQSRDYFILLLGKSTLESTYVIKEIEWALEQDLDIIPIWQPEFEFISDDWPNLSAVIKHKLSNTHRIQVQDENPLEYDKAMTELLNKFGITP